jgi:hypothetical protein
MIAARRLAVGLLGALLAPAAPARAQGAPLWRVVDLSRQLRDSLPQRIRVQYGAGNVDVRPSDDPLLYAMHLRYDERRGVPLHRYDPEQHSALLGIESRSGGGLHVSSNGHDDEAGELRLALPRTVPLDLELELGGTRSALDLGGLSLQSLRLGCGATDATLVFGTPNRTHMRDMEIDVGAADLSASHLANANADQIRVRGGIGIVDLDFSGTWTRDLIVSTRLAMGKLILRVPSDVGVRLDVRRLAASFEHEGLVKRDDGWYSENWDRAPHKLRVHAETVFGKIEVQRGAR